MAGTGAAIVGPDADSLSVSVSELEVKTACTGPLLPVGWLVRQERRQGDGACADGKSPSGEMKIGQMVN